MQYGNSSYNNLYKMQRAGDFFRSVVRGKYHVEENDGDIVVSKRYLFSKRDHALTETDFKGWFKEGNKRFYRDLHAALKKRSKKGLEKPENISLYVVGDKRTGYDPKYTELVAKDFFDRRNYVAPNRTIIQQKEFNEVLEKIGKYGTLAALVGGVFLKVAGRQHGIDLDMPLGMAQLKAVLNGLGNISLYGAAPLSALAGTTGTMSDVNLETYRQLRKEIRDAEINFVGRTDNSLFRACLVEARTGPTEKTYIAVEHPDTLTKFFLRPNEEIIKTVSSRSFGGMERKIEVAGEKLSKKNKTWLLSHIGEEVPVIKGQYVLPVQA